VASAPAEGVPRVASADLAAYNPGMLRRLLCCLLLMGVSLIGQSSAEDKAAIGKLRSTLLALKDTKTYRASLGEQLADNMMALTEEDRRPSRQIVAVFADQMVSALLGKELTAARATALQESIVDVLRGQRANVASASALRETLTALGVDAVRVQSITTRFLAIGHEVRGPDDTAVSPAWSK
jgi:hypothetical protein